VIDDYLLNKFTNEGYNAEHDAILDCQSLDDAKRIFDNCALFKLTECWILMNHDKDFH
jgi:hypothetical protein